MYERALTLCRANGDEDGASSVQKSIVELYDSQAENLREGWDFIGVKKMYEQSLALYRQMNDGEGSEAATNIIAEVVEPEKVWGDVKHLRDPFKPISP